MPLVPLPFDASHTDCEARATALLAALQEGDDGALHLFKWNHPALVHGSFAEARDRAPRLGLPDARLVLARSRAFENWDSMVAFTREVSRAGPVRSFEEAADAVVDGALARLSERLELDPTLVSARSVRRHRATLLHYLSANGLELERQRSPSSALAVGRLLLDAGADPSATARAYGGDCTTLSLLVSSVHPAEAGVQADLALLLVERGATLHPAVEGERAPLDVVLSFGYLDTALRLVDAGAPVRTVDTAAALGLTARVAALWDTADDDARHRAFALAAQHGQAAVVRALLARGADPGRFNPPGAHPHSTPLHQAAFAGHATVVDLLLEAGARTDVRDTVHAGTPLDWARHAGHAAIAARLSDSPA